MIRIRFVTGNDWLSWGIRVQAGTAMPFTPSHVEALTPDGKYYIGAHYKGGILRRSVGYDAAELLKLPDGSRSERIVSLPCTAEQEAAFYRFIEAHIGESYDWKAIIGFLLTEHMHIKKHVICSAFMTNALRAAGCEFFRWPLTVPFHRISPRDLFLILSTHVEIPH